MSILQRAFISLIPQPKTIASATFGVFVLAIYKVPEKYFNFYFSISIGLFICYCWPAFFAAARDIYSNVSGRGVRVEVETLSTPSPRKFYLLAQLEFLAVHKEQCL